MSDGWLTCGSGGQRGEAGAQGDWGAGWTGGARAGEERALLAAGPCGANGRAERSAELGCGCGPRASGRVRLGVERGKRAARTGPCGLGRVKGFPFLFLFLFFSFLNLIQTKFEFKYEFEFKPHSNKVCTNMNATRIFKPMIKF